MTSVKRKHIIQSPSASRSIGKKVVLSYFFIGIGIGIGVDTGTSLQAPISGSSR